MCFETILLSSIDPGRGCDNLAKKNRLPEAKNAELKLKNAEQKPKTPNSSKFCNLNFDSMKFEI